MYIPTQSLSYMQDNLHILQQRLHWSPELSINLHIRTKFILGM